MWTKDPGSVPLSRFTLKLNEISVDTCSVLSLSYWESVLQSDVNMLSLCVSGKVQIFDLGRRSLRAAATIEQGGAGHAATSLAFNARNPRLMAVGDTAGDARRVAAERRPVGAEPEGERPAGADSQSGGRMTCDGVEC